MGYQRCPRLDVRIVDVFSTLSTEFPKSVTFAVQSCAVDRGLLNTRTLSCLRAFDIKTAILKVGQLRRNGQVGLF